MTKRISFLVHGEVQGVNYRSFAQKKASSYGLTGWVSNTSNGKVEGEVQGDAESIQKYLKDLNSGPSAAHVVKVEKSEQEAKEGESSFEVK
ncbi:MAG: acylphosphatase [Lasallia pustulata]|nr:MAG: acylphosphatase [Lasallia pustulata]